MILIHVLLCKDPDTVYFWIRVTEKSSIRIRNTALSKEIFHLTAF